MFALSVTLIFVASIFVASVTQWTVRETVITSLVHSVRNGISYRDEGKCAEIRRGEPDISGSPLAF